MGYLPSELKTTFNVIREKKMLFVVLTFGLVAASLLVNVVVLSIVTGHLPSSFFINDGRFALQAKLDDPVDQFLEEVFPLYNYPLVLIMFPRQFIITNEFGVKENVLLAQPLFLNVHYFADFTPFALLISAYAVLTRHYFSSISAGARGKVKGTRSGTAAGVTSAVTPSVSSGATTALTAFAAGVCCGGFAIESSIYVLGLTISAAGFVLLSRLFMLVMAGFLIFGIFRTSKKINTYCGFVPTR